MTRGDLAELLADGFAPFGIPVAADPFSAVIAPAVVLDAGAPFRTPESLCWSQTVDVRLYAGRADDADVLDRLDALADTLIALCAAAAGVVNRGAPGGRETVPVGDVDYTAVTFNVTLYDLGPGLEEL